MSDTSTTIEELKQLIHCFVEERDWEQFHSPKNLSMALAIEAAELMEHFQWMNLDASRAIAEDSDKLAAVGEEIADVFAYSLALADVLGIDMADAVRDKMAKNSRKYPAEEYRGRYGPDDCGTMGP